MNNNTARIYLEGNNGGDYFELTVYGDGEIKLEVGHCCVKIIDCYVPTEFLTGALSQAVLNAGSIQKAILGLEWPENYLVELVGKVKNDRATIIKKCLECGSDLEPDWEHHYKHYGETPFEQLAAEDMVLFCGNCEMVYDGLGNEI